MRQLALDQVNRLADQLRDDHEDLQHRADASDANAQRWQPLLESISHLRETLGRIHSSVQSTSDSRPD